MHLWLPLRPAERGAASDGRIGTKSATLAPFLSPPIGGRTTHPDAALAATRQLLSRKDPAAMAAGSQFLTKYLVLDCLFHTIRFAIAGFDNNLPIPEPSTDVVNKLNLTLVEFSE